MSLTTGYMLSRRSWKELPMGNDVIIIVESMAISQNQPLLGEDGPLFEWRPGVLFDNEETAEVDLDDTYDVNKYEYAHTKGDIGPVYDSDVDNDEVEHMEDETDVVSNAED